MLFYIFNSPCKFLKTNAYLQHLKFHMETKYCTMHTTVDYDTLIFHKMELVWLIWPYNRTSSPNGTKVFWVFGEEKDGSMKLPGMQGQCSPHAGVGLVHRIARRWTLRKETTSTRSNQTTGPPTRKRKIQLAFLLDQSNISRGPTGYLVRI